MKKIMILYFAINASFAFSSDGKSDQIDTVKAEETKKPIQTTEYNAGNDDSDPEIQKRIFQGYFSAKVNGWPQYVLNYWEGKSLDSHKENPPQQYLPFYDLYRYHIVQASKQDNFTSK